MQTQKNAFSSRKKNKPTTQNQKRNQQHREKHISQKAGRKFKLKTNIRLVTNGFPFLIKPAANIRQVIYQMVYVCSTVALGHDEDMQPPETLAETIATNICRKMHPETRDLRQQTVPACVCAHACPPYFYLRSVTVQSAEDAAKARSQGQ